MKTCFECSRHVLARDSECPFCGAQLRRSYAAPTRWKVELGLVMSLGLAGCTGDGTDEMFATSVDSANSGNPNDSWGEGATYAGPPDSTGVASDPGNDDDAMATDDPQPSTDSGPTATESSSGTGGSESTGTGGSESTGTEGSESTTGSAETEG